MDGVLIDACEWHRIALNEALKEICNYEISLEQHYSEFNGLPTKVKLKKLQEKGIVKKHLFETIESIKQEKTIQIINKFASKRQEKIDLMLFLKSKNIKVACYTNSIRMTAELMLKKIGVLELLDLLITNQDVSVSKPDPEGYIKCMNFFNIDKKNTIIVEDSPKGLEAAKKSGALYVQVKSPDEVMINILENKL